MTPSLPLITVIVPCYKQAHWLPNALDSVLNGDYPAVEIIVIDDGSPDDTAQVAARYVERDPARVRLIRQPNAGVAAARNAALLQATGEWIQLLDADDALRRDALRLKIEVAQRDPLVGVVGGSWEEVDNDGKLIHYPGLAPVIEAPALPNTPRAAFLALFDPLLMGPPCRYLFRRDILLKTGFFEPNLHPCEDWDFFLRAAAHGYAFARAPLSVASYRNHPTSASKHWERMWLKGSLALHRAGQLYPDDARVQRAMREGIRRWRIYCHVTLLTRSLAAAHPLRKRVWQAVAAVRRDPQVFPLLVGALRAHLKQRKVTAKAP